MSIQVTLTKTGPKRLNIHGLLFERNKMREDVSLSIARKLEQDERFKVKIDTSASAAELAADTPAPVADGDDETTEGRPNSRKARIAAIRAAIGELDLDNEEHYTQAGKPDARALSSILKWQVTAEERDAALAKPDDDEAVPKNIHITKKTPIDTGADAAAAAAGDKAPAEDETTKDAVQV